MLQLCAHGREPERGSARVWGKHIGDHETLNEVTRLKTAQELKAISARSVWAKDERRPERRQAV